MEYSFPRYLLAKQTVDDRSLNQSVIHALKVHLPPPPLRIIEVGAGMGNMLARLLSWGLITRAEYVHEDALAENIAFASHWIPEWAARAGLRCERRTDDELRLFDATRDIRVRLVLSDVSSFASQPQVSADLVIANAFLDLLPMPEGLKEVLSLTNNLAWLTINFDGLTAFEPTIDVELDEKIERLYHRTMDTRASGGDSRAGRHLFQYIQALGARVLAAGASDWVVSAEDGKYPGDEAYFLHFILHFFEESLRGNPGLDASEFARWLEIRRSQVNQGELIYIAHQLDYLVHV